MAAPPPPLVTSSFFFFFLLFWFGSQLQWAALAQSPPPPAAVAQAPRRLASRVDLAALYSLRASLGLRARDWPRKRDPCAAWAGVRCEAGRVTGLDLTGLRRTRNGRLDPRFAVDGVQNLTRLAAFNASGFALPGAIPEWFGLRLPASLAVLDLRRCSVSGAIPYSLGNATGLRELYLARNSLAGNVPATLGGLFRLTALDLSGNSLSGSVPPSLASLRNLSYLDLSSNFFTGSVPAEIGTLSSLRTLRLSNNILVGSVPPQVGDLASLVTLELGINSFSGGIPEDLKNLRNLQELDASNNSLSGRLPGDLFAGLRRLRSVRLSHNNFSDALPESLWRLGELLFLDLSYNNLSGRLPDDVPHVNSSSGILNMSHNSYYGSVPVGAGSIFQRFSFVDVSANYFEGQAPVPNLNASFESNCFSNASNQRSVDTCREFYAERGLTYNGSATPPSTSTTTAPVGGSSSGKSNRRLKYILAGVFGGAGFVLILAVVIGCCVMRCGAGAAEQRQISGDAAVSGNPAASGRSAPAPGISVNMAAVGDSFTYEQMLQATSNFGESNFIKHGHSGDIYHGTLEGGVPVVVKRINPQMPKKDAHLIELDFFAKNSHNRFVPFLGHCLEKEDQKFLVYKYMPNGDLSSSLFRKSGQEEEGLQSLDWITRLKIAIGVAEALCYLHHECTPPLVHRDIQASSVLLDDKFEVRLGSLSEVCTQEGDAHQNVITRFLRKTSEQGASGLTSSACAYDVYCLGKVLLELVTGKLGISGSNDTSTNEWLEKTLPYISIYEKELVMKILDPSLIVDDDLLEEVWAMAIVAKSCLNPKPSKRPLVRYILKALENPLKVVREENHGSARLRTTSSRGSWNAALFGSWRQSSSDIASVPGPSREGVSLKRSGTAGSQGSVGEQSLSHKRPSKEIFPEPSGGERDIE